MVHPLALVMYSNAQIAALGARIRARRQRLGLSQSRLAAMTGLSRASVNALESGTTDLGVATAVVREHLLGQIARIHAWVHVPKRLAGTDDGLLVFDSVAGPELGDRVQLTQGWRELTLYRAVPKSGDLTVTFALTGLGAALLWFGWFGFNAGSQLAADGLAGSAFLVTNTSASVGALAWMGAEWAVNRPPLLFSNP